MVVATDVVGREFMYPMSRNSASGPEIGFPDGFRADSNREDIKTGPPAGRRSDVEAFPIRIQMKSGPEARFLARKHYCVT